MATKILILDAVSPLGQAIYQAFESTTYAVLVPVRSALDWTDADVLQAYIDSQGVSIVINAAGWREKPDAEQCAELVQTATALAQAAAGRCSVIHLSSYRVFGGRRQAAYSEDDEPHPVGPAGEAFLAAEQALLKRIEHCICLRLSWVLDVTGDSIFHRLLEDLTSEGPELVVSHQRRGAPLSCAEVGLVVVAMVKQVFCDAQNWGVMHLASGDPCSSAEVAEVVAEILDRHDALKRSWHVETLSEEQLEALGEPESAVLSVRRVHDNFGYQVKSWRQGLSRLLRTWLEQRNINWE